MTVHRKHLLLILLTTLLFAACSSGRQTPTPPIGAATPETESTPGEENTTPRPPATNDPGAAPTHEPRTLTICMGAEPDSLYIYGSSMHAQSNVLEAVYDGPIDNNSFGYQPVILEKLPNLADGDAVLQPVIVREGDTVVDAEGNVAVLASGVTVHPAGCQTPECAIVYQGGEIQMDQLSATFSLLEGLAWSESTPLTAQDSIYSFQLDADSDTPTSKYRTERTASYTALDERTIQWVGLPGFLDQTYFTNFWTPLPQHVWGNTAPSELLEADFSARRPMGWGPYIITEWVAGSHINLAKNQHYFRAAEGLPQFDNLVFRFTGEGPEQNLPRLLSGECDVLDIETHLDSALPDLLELDQSRQIQAHFTTLNIWEHADFGIVPVTYDDGYQFGADRPDFFSDPRTRSAFAYCMDRQQIINTLLFGKSQIPNTYLPSTHPLNYPDAPQYSFDPAAGMALLDEVGWRDADGNPVTARIAQGIPNIPDGTPLSVNYWTTTASQRQQAGQILADSLAQCGIQLIFQAWDPADLFADGPDGPLFGRRFDMAQFAWLTGVTPPCDLYLTNQVPGEDVVRFPYRWGGTNLTGYSNPAFDEACQRALSLLPGQPSYVEAHHLAQQIFAEDLPVIPLYLRIRVTAARPDFCGHAMDPTADSDFWNLEEYDYGQKCVGE